FHACGRSSVVSFGAHHDLRSSPTRRSSDLLRTQQLPHERVRALSGMKLSRLHQCGDLGKQPAPVSGDVLRANLVPLSEHRAGNTDRKSTRLNSSHVKISYAVFCLKKQSKTD